MIVLFISHSLSAKLLVTTGLESGSTKSEIIDLANPKSTCKNWVDYPLDLDVASGQIIDKYPHICGGDRGNYKNHCYKMTPKSAISLPSLATRRGWSSSAVFNSSLFVVGGISNGHLSSTEYISKTKQRYGPNAPIKGYGHCIIQINDNEILLTGGYMSR